MLGTLLLGQILHLDGVVGGGYFTLVGLDTLLLGQILHLDGVGYTAVGADTAHHLDGVGYITVGGRYLT